MSGTNCPDIPELLPELSPNVIRKITRYLPVSETMMTSKQFASEPKDRLCAMSEKVSPFVKAINVLCDCARQNKYKFELQIFRVRQEFELQNRKKFLANILRSEMYHDPEYYWVEITPENIELNWDNLNFDFYASPEKIGQVSKRYSVGDQVGFIYSDCYTYNAKNLENTNIIENLNKAIIRSMIDYHKEYKKNENSEINYIAGNMLDEDIPILFKVFCTGVEKAADKNPDTIKNNLKTLATNLNLYICDNFENIKREERNNGTEDIRNNWENPYGWIREKDTYVVNYLGKHTINLGIWSSKGWDETYWRSFLKSPDTPLPINKDFILKPPNIGGVNRKKYKYKGKTYSIKTGKKGGEYIVVMGEKKYLK